MAKYAKLCFDASFRREYGQTIVTLKDYILHLENISAFLHVN